MPLLIGGATTSRVHTAVKIAPHYEAPVVYVPDASRSVSVCSDLLSDERRASFVAEWQADADRVRALHAAKKGPALVTLAAARGNPTPIDWAAFEPPVPRVLGRRVLRNIELAEIAALIDWTPFFQTWDLAGRYPAILDDNVVGEAARKVFADGRAMLDQAVRGRWLQAHAVFGLYPADTVEHDDIQIYHDPERQRLAMTWHGLRLQTERPVVDGVRRPNRCLADFVAPRGVAADHIGLFAVTTGGPGLDARVAAFEAAHDDYSAIMLKALADRLAEALAEWLHRRVRTEFWGYATDEAAEPLSVEALIDERYRGIRPAPGYPACPDHAPKRAMFELLQAQEIGMGLTETLAMTPASSVSGFYIAHPDAAYFNVGRIGADQAEDWARRSGASPQAVRRLLDLG
jgi:5-methyltetrahydrofolate--homocysteine methyltransferase